MPFSKKKDSIMPFSKNEEEEEFHHACLQKKGFHHAFLQKKEFHHAFLPPYISVDSRPDSRLDSRLDSRQLPPPTELAWVSLRVWVSQCLTTIGVGLLDPSHPFHPLYRRISVSRLGVSVSPGYKSQLAVPPISPLTES